MTVSFAHIDPNNYNAKPSKSSSDRLPCQQGEAQIDMEINNVRARLLTGGDVWWDLDNGRYIVPKPAAGAPEVSSIFAGGVWIGGVDVGNNIKLAGVTYRSGTTNYDWFPGPLDKSGFTESEVCRSWDRFFTVRGKNVLKHVVGWDEAKTDYICDSIPEDVRYWPGQGNPYWGEKFEFDLSDQPLGSFWDEDGDGVYNPCNGDFPIIDIRKCEPVSRDAAKELVPDEMKFWVYNDNGNTQLLTRGTPIQMEVQVQAFAYATNDQINDMTFYRYKLLNKANSDIFNCYFAMWVDPDLGCYADDYIGVDVERSMAYVYNQDAVDGDNGSTCSGGINTYGENIPLLGIDYFRGPRGAKVFKRDDDGVVILDLEGQPTLIDPPKDMPQPADTLVEIGMTSFIYMENCSVGNPDPNTCDPSGTDQPFYNYLQGLWLDGTPITFGNSGYTPSSMDTVKYVFPGDPSDPNGWSMCTSDLPFGERRTLQATGPLVLQPGATNELIIGVPFVPNEQSYPCPDLSRLRAADDIAQALFDNCFDILDGPDAPDVAGVELDRELILVLSNDTIASNNSFLNYSEKDIFAEKDFEEVDYKFEGYKIYQLANASVTPQEISDVTKARLVSQVDIKNGVSKLYNWTSMVDPTGVGENLVWTPSLKVDGADAGLRTSFSVVEDQFAESNRRLVNHRKYHFMVLAYGYNQYKEFDFTTGLGQKSPYFEGRRNVQVYSFSPRPIVYQDLQASYGDEAQITRLSGEGNGGRFLDLVEGSHDAILNGDNERITYVNGAGPFQVKVYNPIEIKNGSFRLELVGDMDLEREVCALDNNTTWVLTDLDTDQMVASDRTIDGLNEQLILKKGFSVSISQVRNPGDTLEVNNGAIGSTIDYADIEGPQWFNSIPDGGFGGFRFNNTDISLDPAVNRPIYDKDNLLSGMGPFFPFISAEFVPGNGVYSVFEVNPGGSDNNLQALLVGSSRNFIKPMDLNNVDIVFTSDRNKWSRCIVVETASPLYTKGDGLKTIDNVKQLDIRKAPSVDKFGAADDSGTTGMGWFPGYAINVETGKRLNIFFGENSVFSNNPDNNSIVPVIADSLDVPSNYTSKEIGSDMIWNPTSQALAPNIGTSVFSAAQVVVGGQHFVYVSSVEYDECESLIAKMNSASPLSKAEAWGTVTWCTVPLLDADAEMLSYADGFIPNDLTVKVRVYSPYSKERFTNPDVSNTVTKCFTLDELPAYEFTFDNAEVRELDKAEYANALSNVRIVPNPYYAYSAYESSPFTNTVKVTNLPERAIVTIYTIDGKFIRRFDREERPGIIGGANSPNTTGQINASVDWDMKNNKGIPIASGVYLFHVEAPELGEEIVLKWFGVNRKFDPSTL
jgi:hypothetical protein